MEKAKPVVEQRTASCRRNTIHTEVKCNNCGMHSLCQLAGLDDADKNIIDKVINRKQEISTGKVLFEAGEEFKGIYAVKSGMFKTITYFNDGKEQIIDFYLPGELIGLDAINEKAYLYKVIAMQDSSVCEMDFDAMGKLDEKFVSFQASLIQALSRKVRLDQYQSLLTSAQNADQRLAVFLLGISMRFKAHGLPDNEFRLSILRKDIANYLGLALETVSRIFKKFETKGLISTRGKRVQLLDVDALNKLACIT